MSRPDTDFFLTSSLSEKGSVEMNTKKMNWETDAEKIDVSFISNILFKNNIVDKFIDSNNKYFIIATKGIGKTLLLNYKRYKLEMEEDKGIIFIPTSKPYLDFVPDFGFLSKDHLNFLSDWKNCKMLWELAIEISAFSYYSYGRKETSEEMSHLKEINKGMHKYLELTMVKPINPTFMLVEILSMSITNVMQFLDYYSNKIRSTFTNIQSGVIVFIDRVDQSLIKYNSSEVWINVQIGLLEASWDIMRMNHHIKIYTSIRQEAYANYSSPNREAISGEVSLIKYTQEDLRGILNNLSNFYENKSYVEFIGFPKLKNLFAQKEEDSFNYLYRHTIGRPRDFVSICSNLSPEKNINEERFREIVNNTAATNIINSAFAEVEILLGILKNKNDREKFLSLLPYDILTLDELKDVCREFNGLEKCPSIDNCKKCEHQNHPFCEFYNIGLLGIVKKDYDSDKLKQKFVEPSEMNQVSNWLLPNSSYYLVHPAIHVYIDDLRNRLFGKRYNMIHYLLIGNNCPWEEQYSNLIDIQKIIIKKVPTEKTKDYFLSIFKDFLKKPQEVINKLKEAGKTVGDKSVEIDGIIKLLLKNIADSQNVTVIPAGNISYNPKAHILPDERTFSPFTRFPEKVERFASNNFPEIWRKYDKNIQNYLKNLSIKFETIRQIIPNIGGNYPVVGFEALALGPSGENYFAVEKWAEEKGVEKPELSAILFYLAILSIVTLKLEAGSKKINMTEFFFDVNIGPPLFTKSNYPIKILESFKQNLNDIQLEILEETKPENIKALEDILRIFPQGLSLDDANELHPTVRANIMASGLCKCVKVDNKFAKEVFDRSLNNPEKALNMLYENAGNAKIFVVEGIENENDLLFLKYQWTRKEGESLCVQGWIIFPDNDWIEKGLFYPLKDMKHPCGYSLQI